MNELKKNIIFEDGYIMGKEDTKIYYRAYELEESNASIVISHGFCESIEKYKELINIFNENNYSVYIIDHRGHGKSDRLGRDMCQINVEKFEYYVEDLKTFLDSVVIPNNNKNELFLFAHSMGGAIGGLFLQKYGKYFSRAILNCPMMEINTGKYPSLASKIAAKFMCMVRKGDSYILGHGPCLIDENEYPKTSGGSFNWLNEAFKASSALTKKENVENIKIPILLFQAGKDTFVKAGGQNKFAKNVKSCELIIREEAKHEIYVKKDEFCDDYINDILKFYSRKLKMESKLYGS